jgi:cytochrome c
MSTARWFLLGVLSLAATAHAAPDKLPGEQVYARCAACHALAYDRVGPHHCGLLGRRAGTVPGFAYSPAMQVVPGTTMTYAGIPDAKERSDLIAYLKHANDSAECRPGAPPR